MNYCVKQYRRFTILFMGLNILFIQPTMKIIGASAEKTGSLSYFRDFDFSGKNRIHEMDGTFAVCQYKLSYHSMPAGVMDGDGGSDFYMKITAPEKIEIHKKYILNESIFQARVAAWASPAYYQILPNLSGEIHVLDYRRYHYLDVSIDIHYGMEPKQHFTGRIRFTNQDFSKKIPGKTDWYAFDTKSLRKPNEIKIADITGSWRAVDFVMESNGVSSMLLDKELDLRRIMEIKSDKLRRQEGEDELPFVLENNHLVIQLKQDSHERKLIGVINYIDAESLTISWIENWKYDGRDFQSTMRFIHKRMH